MGQDLANRLSLRNDRNEGTITNRDYTLIRSGDGLDTEYDVEQEEKVAIDLSAYADALDLEAMLSQQFFSAWPDFADQSPNGSERPAAKAAPKAAPAPKAVPAKRARRAADEDAPAKVAPLAERIKASPVSAADGGSTEDPPSEAPAEPESGEGQDMLQAAPDAPVEAEGDQVEITEDDLRKMSRQELIKLARQAELQVSLTMSRDQIVEAFLQEFAV
jgi:hypothetical protein